jgi:hypothetical protein
MEAGMFLNPTGAVEIDGLPCRVFSVGHHYDRKFSGGENYAVSREGRVYVRDDYLLKYVIQPYYKIQIEAKTD